MNVDALFSARTFWTVIVIEVQSPIRRVSKYLFKKFVHDRSKLILSFEWWISSVQWLLEDNVIIVNSIRVRSRKIWDTFTFSFFQSCERLTKIIWDIFKKSLWNFCEHKLLDNDSLRIIFQRRKEINSYLKWLISRRFLIPFKGKRIVYFCKEREKKEHSPTKVKPFKEHFTKSKT